MGRKFKISYVRIKNKSGKSRQVRLRKAEKRKTNPLRRYSLIEDRLIVSHTRRRSLKSRGLRWIKIIKNQTREEL